MRILVVEDDEVLRDGIRAGLSLDGFTVDGVSTLTDARLATGGTEYDAIVLDVGLPDGSGIELLTGLRAAGSATPILLLTARSMTSDRIEGLNAGADDYLGKPFDLDELAARVRAIGRRAKGNAAPNMTIGNLSFDPARREMRRGGDIVPLTRREMALAEMLFEQPGRIFSRSQLEDRLYGWGEEVGSNAVEVHVHKLRTKLGKDVIETVRGQGYRLTAR